MRSLARKVVIDNIEEMDADNLECARIGGWRVVVKKGEFRKGDVGLYFEIDSALNPHDDRFAFLKERCYKEFMLSGTMIDECIRIKTMKLRGVISQGLLLPCNLFLEIRDFKIDEDCTSALAIRHYDDIAEKIRMIKNYGGKSNKSNKTHENALPSFPAFIPKTDEERIQNLKSSVIEKHSYEVLEVTEKADGSSLTMFYCPSMRNDEPFGVCSRNHEIKRSDGNKWWDAAKKYDVENILKKIYDEHGLELAIQGELVGPGIQCNRDFLEDFQWKVFRIWNIRDGRFLNWEERKCICKENNLEHVKTIGFYKMNDFDCDIDQMLKFAEGKTDRGNEREGLVWKSNDGDFTFKTVSNRYLLKLND